MKGLRTQPAVHSFANLASMTVGCLITDGRLRACESVRGPVYPSRKPCFMHFSSEKTHTLYV